MEERVHPSSVLDGSMVKLILMVNLVGVALVVSLWKMSPLDAMMH